MTVSRRQVIGLGAAGAAGVVAARLGALQPASATLGVGGIHIYVTAHVKLPSGPFPHTFIATLWGADDAMSGTGVGFTDDPSTLHRNLAGGMVANCVVGLWGKVEGDVASGKGVMAYSADPDERRGQPFLWEANVATGLCKFTDVNVGMGTEFVAEGVGTVMRI